MTAEIERRLALEAEADRLAAFYIRIRETAWPRRAGLLDAGREAVVKRLVAVDDWDLMREAAGEP